MNVLISSAGRRVSLVKAFKKELEEFNPHSKVFTSDANPQLSAACQSSDGYFSVPLVSDHGFISQLLDACKLHDINLIIPTIDAELLPLSKHKAHFREKGIEIVVPSHDFVSMCRDKRKTHDFFMAHGIEVAKEYNRTNLDFPLFVKPCDGSRSEGAFLASEASDLNEEHFNDPKLMFLQYLDHSIYDEFTVDLYYSRNHELKCIVPRKRLMVRDGEVNKGLTVNNKLIPLIRSKMGIIPGAVGCLTTQFFMDKKENSIFGIEINPRFGGGFPLTYHSGANFPKWIIAEFLNGEPIEEQFESWQSNLLMLRYDDEIFVHGYKG